MESQEGENVIKDKDRIVYSLFRFFYNVIRALELFSEIARIYAEKKLRDYYQEQEEWKAFQEFQNKKSSPK
jgi:hypothetical protein